MRLLGQKTQFFGKGILMPLKVSIWCGYSRAYERMEGGKANVEEQRLALLDRPIDLEDQKVPLS